MNPYLMLGIAIVFEVAATLLLKASDGLAKWQYLIGSLLCYLVAGVLLSQVLQRIQVGISYAIWAGSGIALICVSSAIIYGQRLDFPAYAGIALIVCGVLLITTRSAVTL